MTNLPQASAAETRSSCGAMCPAVAVAGMLTDLLSGLRDSFREATPDARTCLLRRLDGRSDTRWLVEHLKQELQE